MTHQNQKPENHNLKRANDLEHEAALIRAREKLKSDQEKQWKDASQITRDHERLADLERNRKTRKS